jgi:hypothetical protein
MPSLANEIGWWPIHAALAWVYTRDLSLTVYAARRGYKSLKASIDAYQRNTEDTEVSVHPVTSEDDAWPKFREAISKEKVRARGVPSNDEERSTADEEELPPREAAVLVLGSSWYGKTYLRPENWKFNEARFWHDVKIARDDLEEQFPALVSATVEPADSATVEPPHQGLENGQAISMKAHRRKAAADAIRELYGPNGPGPGILQDQCFRRVNDLLGKRADGPLPVSLSLRSDVRWAM